LFRIKEEEKQKPQPDQKLIDDIGTALRYVEEDFSDQAASLKSLLEQKEITYDLLWAIFPPKEVVIAPKYGTMNQEQAYNLTDSNYSRRPNDSEYFYVNGQIITFDGQDFGHGSLAVEIDKFEGSRKITALVVYPIRHHPNELTLRQNLIARGKKYLSLLEKPACRDYPVTYAVKEITLADGSNRSEKFNVCLSLIFSHFSFSQLTDDARRWEELWPILRDTISTTVRRI
jgi:hypothetical protein